MGAIGRPGEVHRDGLFGRGIGAAMARAIPRGGRHDPAHDTARDLPRICAHKPAATEGSRRMNLSWHIAKKDLRRFWAPILAVCMITALRLTVGVCLIRSDGSDPDYFGRMAIYADVMWGIGLFLTYMLVGA